MSDGREQNGRFSAGNRANPNGRPRNSRSVNDVILREMKAPVTVTENNKRRKISKLQANAKQIVNIGASGDLRAAKMTVDYALRADGAQDAAPIDLPLTQNDHAIVERFIARLNLTEMKGAEMTIMPSREEFDALTRMDFNVFVERVFTELNGAEPYLDNYHVGTICAELEAARRGETLRLAIALPPRSLKSIIISVAYPAWLLGHNPEAKIICASYGAQLAEELARDCRQVIRSDWYRRLFPGTRLKSDRQSIASFETTAGGSRISTSVGGVLTGFGADVIIVDDPTKPEEALSEVERAKANHWLSHTLLTRLNDKTKGVIILVMQRLHEDDMIGYFVRLTEAKLVSFPAIAQEQEVHEWQTPFGTRRHSRSEGEVLHAAREPPVALEQLRLAMGARMFAAQYLQMPAPPGGSIVKPEWFPRYDLSNPPHFDTVFQSWDTASKATQLSDYSVCTTWGKKDGRLYLINVLRKRLEYPDLKRAVIDQARFFNAKKVLIEDASSGQALVQDLHNDGFWICEAIKADRDKVMRFRSVTSPIEAGLVFVPERAPWLEDFFHELMMFPASRYDDQVDSTSQALTNAHLSLLGRWLVGVYSTGTAQKRGRSHPLRPRQLRRQGHAVPIDHRADADQRAKWKFPHDRGGGALHRPLLLQGRRRWRDAAARSIGRQDFG